MICATPSLRVSYPSALRRSLHRSLKVYLKANDEHTGFVEKTAEASVHRKMKEKARVAGAGNSGRYKMGEIP